MSGIATAVIGVIGAGASIYASSKASKSADKQTDAYEYAAANEQQLAQAQWNRYVDTFIPLEDAMIDQYVDPNTGKLVPVEKTPGYASTMGQIDRSFSDVAANTKRTLGGRYQYGSGLEKASQDTIGLERSRAKAGAAVDLENNRLATMINLASLGRNLPANAASGMSNVTATQGNLSAMANNAAQQSWNSTGNTVGNLSNMLMQNYMLNKGV